MDYKLRGKRAEIRNLGKDAAVIQDFAKEHQVHIHLARCELENHDRKRASRLPASDILERAVRAAKTGHGRDFQFGRWTIEGDYARRVTAKAYRYPASTEAAVALVSPSRKHVYLYMEEVDAKRSEFFILGNVVPGSGVMRHWSLEDPVRRREYVLEAMTHFMVDAAERGDKKLVRGLVKACEREERAFPGTIDAIAEGVQEHMAWACEQSVREAIATARGDAWEKVTSRPRSEMHLYHNIPRDTREATRKAAEEAMKAAEEAISPAEIEANTMSQYADLIDALSPINTETESESESLAPAA